MKDYAFWAPPRDAVWDRPQRRLGHVRCSLFGHKPQQFPDFFARDIEVCSRCLALRRTNAAPIARFPQIPEEDETFGMTLDELLFDADQRMAAIDLMAEQSDPPEER